MWLGRGGGERAVGARSQTQPAGRFTAAAPLMFVEVASGPARAMFEGHGLVVLMWSLLEGPWSCSATCSQH